MVIGDGDLLSKNSLKILTKLEDCRWCRSWYWDVLASLYWRWCILTSLNCKLYSHLLKKELTYRLSRDVYRKKP